MEDYFNQVREVAKTHLYFLSLGAALTIPDMCAGMESANGRSSGALYKAWVDQYLAPRYVVGPAHTPSFSGEDCYGLRCAFLHQGYLEPHAGSYTRVIFTEPHSGITMHNNVMNDALNIDVTIFANQMVDAAEQWISAAKSTSNFRANYPKFMQRYEGGLSPYIVGIPVIG
jgi:hypothetical protein